MADNQHQYLLASQERLQPAPPRREWWWLPGPVDSCCCCFSLPTGTTLLAWLWVISGLGALVSVIFCNSELGYDSMENKQNEWDLMCLDLPNPTPECTMLMKDIMNIKFVRTTPGTVCGGIGALSLVFGMIGVVAVCTYNPETAKAFYWSAILELVGDLACVFLYYPFMGSGEEVFTVALGVFIDTFFGLYFAKVAWSFFKLTERKRASRPGGFAPVQAVVGGGMSDASAPINARDGYALA